MRSLPSSLEKYKETPKFTEKTVPQGLLKDHSTKSGVWGRIVVVAGELDYIILGKEQETHSLSVNNFGIVEPEVLHYIRPVGKVEFYVEFYR